MSGLEASSVYFQAFQACSFSLTFSKVISSIVLSQVYAWNFIIYPRLNILYPVQAVHIDNFLKRPQRHLY